MKLAVALLALLSLTLGAAELGQNRFLISRDAQRSAGLLPRIDSRTKPGAPLRVAANQVVGWVYSPTARPGAIERWASTPTLQETSARSPAICANESPTATESPTTAADENIHFATVNVFIDTRNSALAAYQFEFLATQGRVEIVGVESGGHPAFASRPPYYDPAALHREHRVIVAAYSTANDLPTGKTCVARLHLAVYGDAKPSYQATIQAAASPAGKSIVDETAISVSEGTPQ